MGRPRGPHRHRTRKIQKPQKGGGDYTIHLPLTPKITDPATLQANMDLFYIGAHGSCALDGYCMVPPKTFLFFTGEAGKTTPHFWHGEKYWLLESPHFWEQVYNVLYGITPTGDISVNASAKAFVQEMRMDPKRQIYFPGDIIPNHILFFNTTTHVKPMGIFTLPIEDNELLNLWKLSDSPEKFIPTWSVMEMFARGYLTDEDLSTAKFVSPEMEAFFRQQVQLPQASRDFKTPLKKIFQDVDSINAAIDMWFHSRPSNYLFSIPGTTKMPSSNIRVPILSLFNDLNAKPASKSYRFLLAPVCRQTTEWTPQTEGIGQPSTRLARRFSMCASGMCAAPEEKTLNIFKLCYLLQKILHEEYPSPEYDVPTNPYALQIRFINVLATGKMILPSHFSILLDLSSLPTQEDVSPLYQEFQTELREVFRPLRRELPKNFLRVNAVSAGTRMFEAYPLPPLARGDYHKNAVVREEAELRKEEEQRLRNTETQKKKAGEVIGVLKSKLVSLIKRIQGLIDELPTLTTVSELNASSKESQDLYNEFYQIESDIQTMSEPIQPNRKNVNMTYSKILIKELEPFFSRFRQLFTQFTYGEFPNEEIRIHKTLPQYTEFLRKIDEYISKTNQLVDEKVGSGLEPLKLFEELSSIHNSIGENVSRMMDTAESNRENVPSRIHAALFEERVAPLLHKIDGIIQSIPPIHFIKASAEDILPDIEAAVQESKKKKVNYDYIPQLEMYLREIETAKLALERTPVANVDPAVIAALMERLNEIGSGLRVEILRHSNILGGRRGQGKHHTRRRQPHRKN